MRPIVINWVTYSSTNSLAANAAVVVNVPVILNYNSTIFDSETDSEVDAYLMPSNEAQPIIMTAATGVITGNTFIIDGVNEAGDYITESVVSFSGPTISVNSYLYVISVTPTNNLQGTINIGVLAVNTETPIQSMDVYNKVNNYTIAYTNVTGSVEITPYYTVNEVHYFENNQQKTIETFAENPSLYFEVPIANNNVIVSPSTITTLPITTNASVSLINIPLTGLLTVTSGSGSFTQTIIQQGALV